MIGLVITAFAFSVVALIIGCVALSAIVGLKNSTHQIQYMPIDQIEHESDEGKNLNDDYEEAMGFKHEDSQYT